MGIGEGTWEDFWIGSNEYGLDRTLGRLIFGRADADGDTSVKRLWGMLHALKKLMRSPVVPSVPTCHHWTQLGRTDAFCHVL